MGGCHMEVRQYRIRQLAVLNVVKNDRNFLLECYALQCGINLLTF